MRADRLRGLASLSITTIAALLLVGTAGSAAAAPAASVPDTRVTGWTNHTVGLAWSEPAGGTWSYWVRVDGATPPAQVARTAAGVRANVPVAPGAHRLQVVAVDAAGRRAESAPTAVDTRAPFRDTVAPTPPAPPRVAGVAATSASASWNWASDDSGAIANYEVSADGGSTWQKAYRTLPAHATPWYTFLGLTPGTTHRLGVRAVDAAGNASTPAFATARTAAAADSAAPSAPANLRTVSGPGGTALTAEPSRDDSQRVARYTLAYADDARLGLAPALLYTISGTARPRFDLAHLVAACALGPGRYTVSLRAFDSTGNVSGPSNPLTFVV